MKHLIKQTFIWFIIIGTIAWATATIIGQTSPTFINTYTVTYGNYTKTLYYLDVHNYLQTLELNLKVPIKDMFYNPPAPPKITWSNVINSIPNVMIYILNLMIWWLNVTVFVPTKLLLQPLILILTLLGVDLQQYGIITFVYKLYALKPPIINYL